MLFFLCQVTKVFCWTSCEDLATWHNCSFFDYSTSRDNCKRLHVNSSFNCWAHSNEWVVFQDTGVKAHICTYIDVLSNFNLVSLAAMSASNPCAVLDRWVLANWNSSCVTPYYNSMPQGRSFSKFDISNYCCVWCNPVSIKQARILWVTDWHATHTWHHVILMCSITLISHALSEQLLANSTEDGTDFSGHVFQFVIKQTFEHF